MELHRFFPFQKKLHFAAKTQPAAALTQPISTEQQKLHIPYVHFTGTNFVAPFMSGTVRPSRAENS